MTKTKRRDQTWGDTTTKADDVWAALGLDDGRRRKKRRRKSAFQTLSPEQAAARALLVASGQLEATKKRRPSTEVVAEVADEDLQRRRDVARGQAARLVPYRLTAATAAAGTAAWGIGEFTELTVGSGAHTATGVISGVAVAGGLAWWRVAKRRLFWRGWGRRYWAATAGAATFTMAAGSVGPSWELAAALAVTAGGLSARWMRIHEVPHPADPQRALPGPGNAGPPTSMEAFAQRWHDLIGCPGGLLVGSKLTGHGTFDGGMIFELQLAGGKTLADVQRLLGSIASALGCDALQLVVERPDRNEAGFRPESLVKLTYLLRSPITGIVEHEGPVYRDGRIPLGPYADGQSTAEYVLFSANSMWSGVVAGSTGSGKSALVTALLASARSSGHIVTLYLDPKRNSSPELAAAATVSVLGTERVVEFVGVVEQLVRGRALAQAAAGRSGFVAGRDGPGYLVVIDECDMALSLEGIAARVAILAKTGRALGVAFLLLTQLGDLKAYGGDEMVRSSVAAGNVVLLRIATGGSGGRLAKGLPDPATLPVGPGYGYLQAQDARRAPFRSYRLRSLDDCETEGIDPKTSWNAATALERCRDADLDAVGRKALGPLLADEDADRAADARGDAAAMLAAWLGDEAELPAVEPAAAPEPWGPIPRPLVAPEPAEAPAPTVETPEGLTANQAAVWAALPPVGTATTKEIVMASGLKADAVGKVLPALAKKGLAVTPKRGHWGRATP